MSITLFIYPSTLGERYVYSYIVIGFTSNFFGKKLSVRGDDFNHAVVFFPQQDVALGWGVPDEIKKEKGLPYQHPDGFGGVITEGTTDRSWEEIQIHGQNWRTRVDNDQKDTKKFSPHAAFAYPRNCRGYVDAFLFELIGQSKIDWKTKFTVQGTP